MNNSKKTFLIFVAALLVLTFAASQVWGFVLDQRQGEAELGEAVVAAVSMPLLVASGVVVLRILYVTARPRPKRRPKPTEGG
jgi:hypothetical protein